MKRHIIGILVTMLILAPEMANCTETMEHAYTRLHHAAVEGDGAAQNNLGLMYEEGTGVKQDYAEAIKWYSMAAKKGNSNAQNNLGLMYAYGTGVQRNDTEAVKWFRMAAKQGNANAQEALKSLGALKEPGSK